MVRVAVLALLLVPALLFATAAGAERTVVYKVTHADGTVSYSQDPVAGAEKLVVGSSGASTPVGGEDVPPTPIPDELRAGSDEAELAMREACANATANLAVYQSGDSVTLARGEGDAVTLTGDELEQARTQAQAQVDRYCKDDPAD